MTPVNGRGCRFSYTVLVRREQPLRDLCNEAQADQGPVTTSSSALSVSGFQTECPYSLKMFMVTVGG